MSLEGEIAQRRPVWVALSGLFLDTDVRSFYPSIAATLAESPYTLEEIRTILRDEVAPVLQGNLLQPAGEWAGFEEEWMVCQMAARLGKPRLMPLANLDLEWNEVAHLVALLRKPPGE